MVLAGHEFEPSIAGRCQLLQVFTLLPTVMTNGSLSLSLSLSLSVHIYILSIYIIYLSILYLCIYVGCIVLSIIFVHQDGSWLGGWVNLPLWESTKWSRSPEPLQSLNRASTEPQ